MIQLKNVTLGYGNVRLVRNIDITIPNASLTALIGRNGSGKSTLLRAMAGIGKISEGEIYLDDICIAELSTRDKAKRMAFVNTERSRVPNLRCRDIVAMGRAPYTGWAGSLQKIDREIIDKSLIRVGMGNYADRTMDKMSDGECQRITIARALAQDTSNILLDEPTSFLDMPARYELCELLSDLSYNHKKTVVFSTHELDIAMKYADYILLITDNKALMGTPQEIKHDIRNAFALNF